ncbi:cytochrome P450 [Corynespora cassiicola Philippines]|uniref:Cytochrome P450 n=1 Tax=Corynespora cassiicola Philippines TaxID=1448308 RepID=A0A2T2NTH9_CORCC|nr:cytochrome P450 [Corynespora cassiicola Philippines]
MTTVHGLFPDTDPKGWAAIVSISFITYYIVWITYARTLHPLAKIPGPLWPAVSRTWLMYRMYAGDMEIASRALHERYGPLVRIAPNEVTCSDPEAIPRIYHTHRPLEKTDWYLAFRPVGIGGRTDLFTELNEKNHADLRKIVGPVYSLSNILKNEDKEDECMELFMKILGEFADDGEEFDFGLWLEMYAYDVVGAMFTGKRFGFLEERRDHGNYIQAIWRAMPFLSVVAMAPSYIRPLLQTSALLFPKLFKAILAVDDIRKTAVRETKETMARAEEATAMSNDIISQLTTIVHTRGEKLNFTDKEVTSLMWSAVIAGADSTSIAMRAIFYFMMKNPSVMEKAQAEVDAAFEKGTLRSPVQYSQVITLPYLNAVIKESMRLFPSFQLPMPRVAPLAGLELGGMHVPQGYRVGMNAGVVHYNKEVFGSDASEFNPERWLESDERNRAMDKATLTFGAGTRTCIGKNISLTEIYKLVPELVHRFTVKMAHDRPWTVRNTTFILQTDVICTLNRRTPL